MFWAQFQASLCLVTQLCPTLCDLMDCANQDPLFMGYSRQEYWNGCHFLLQGIFPTQGLNLRLSCLLHWQAGSLPLAPSGKPPDIPGTSQKTRFSWSHLSPMTRETLQLSPVWFSFYQKDNQTLIHSKNSIE